VEFLKWQVAKIIQKYGQEPVEPNTGLKRERKDRRKNDDDEDTENQQDDMKGVETDMSDMDNDDN